VAALVDGSRSGAPSDWGMVRQILLDSDKALAVIADVLHG
jgi:hypothetical protein